MDRSELAGHLVERLQREEDALRARFRETGPEIGHCQVDDLLPDECVERIHRAFPEPQSMRRRQSFREHKHVTAQMDRHDPILEEAVYAFQDERVVRQIATICGIDSLYPDEELYAGGLSLMGPGQFLNPHLDNSHDHDRRRWRVLNLLYYVTPGWQESDGGNLELWPRGVKGEPHTIVSRFNRLVIMATHGGSWHSVSPVRSDRYRACVSNYYFSDRPLRTADQFHVTSFRGRPEQPLRDLLLRGDRVLRQGIRKVLPGGAVATDHVYRRADRSDSDD